MSDLKSNEYYRAEFSEWEGKECTACWGVNIDRKYGNVFTVELANEFLAMANEKYKQIFGKEVDFCKVKYDMTEYLINEDYVLDDGISHPRSYKVKTIGTYDKRKNLLRIYKNDIPVYENYNGKICRDSVAMMDSDTN